MNIEYIKNKVNNFQNCSIEEIEEILNFIAERKRQELGIQFEFDTVYEDGGKVNPEERSAEGYLQVEIGEWALADIKGNKDLGEEIDPTEERKEFIELILQTFHELRHVKQYDNVIDHPVPNEENRKITREIIINESFLGFRNRFNYEQSMAEIDAMKTSLEEVVKFFQEMGSDITPDEVFTVMKEKEFQYLNYDEQDYGDSYETAIEFFNQIYGKISDIRGLPEIIQSLPEDKKAILETECQELMDAYNLETDIEKRMDLLERMSLLMTPKLKEQYPLANMQDIDLEKLGQDETEKGEMKISNLDVEQELSDFYTDDITNDYLEAYLAEKISLIYGDRLGNAGIFNVRKFLSGKLEHFEGVDSYKAIIDELESTLEAAEGVREGEVAVGEVIQQSSTESFEQLLMNEGFNPDCIQGLKTTIKSVNPKTLVAMDSVLSQTKEQTLTRGGVEDGNEQGDR